MRRKVEYCFAVIVSIFCSSVPDIYGSGFAVYTHDAAALGQGNSAIAHTEGPSAIFFNPALISKLEGTQIQVGTTLIIPSREVKSDFTGDTERTEPTVFFPSTLFFTRKFNDKVSGGLGVFSPFGLGTEWDGDWEGRYITTNSRLKTFNFNPVIAYQLTPNIAVAAGVDFIILDADLEKKINLNNFSTLLPNVDYNQKFSGDGNGIGYNLGVVYDISRDISFGASYRSEVKVDIEGDATFELPSVYTPNTGGETDITLPQQAYAGMCYKGFDHLTLEAGIRWEGWSSYDELKFDFEQPILGSRTVVFKKDWKDTYGGNIGAQYQLNDTVSLRAGYLYSENPVPDMTFEPSIPDSNTHLFTIGTGLKYRQARIDLAYGYQLLEKRDKENSIDDNPNNGLNVATSANGEYGTHLHLVGLSLTYVF